MALALHEETPLIWHVPNAAPPWEASIKEMMPEGPPMLLGTFCVDTVKVTNPAGTLGPEGLEVVVRTVVAYTTKPVAEELVVGPPVAEKEARAL